MKKIEDVDTFSEYFEPCSWEISKVVVGVLLTAFAPDLEHHPSYVQEKI